MGLSIVECRLGAGFGTLKLSGPGERLRFVLVVGPPYTE
jgi:hypothetical protein